MPTLRCYEWQAWWAAELDSHPTSELTYHDRMDAIYRTLWDVGVTTDVVNSTSDLDRYRLVIVPTLYLVDDGAVRNLEAFVTAGGTALVTYFSGIVDENDHVRLGGYPGAFRDLLGVWVEEFFPLAPGQTVHLATAPQGPVDGVAAPTGAKALRRRRGPLPGVPAVNENAYGKGTDCCTGHA